MRECILTVHLLRAHPQRIDRNLPQNSAFAFCVASFRSQVSPEEAVAFGHLVMLLGKSRPQSNRLRAQIHLQSTGRYRFLF